MSDKLTIERLTRAYNYLRDNATFQGHEHWDKQGTCGRNCPLCIAIAKARKEADKIFEGE